MATQVQKRSSVDQQHLDASPPFKTTPLPPIRLKCTVPEGLALAKNKYGIGVFASKPYKKGEILYKGHYDLLPPAQAPLGRPIKLVTQSGEYDMDVQTHTCALDEEGNRALYYFDGYMNHSCEPNTYSISITDTSEGGEFYQTALRDIEPGDEITCDYDLFEWDARDKGIDHCQCGSAACRGSALGFRFLTAATQFELIASATAPCVLEGFAAEHPRVFFRNVQAPEGWKIAPGKHGDGLIALRPFKAGDLLFHNTSEYFEVGKYDRILIGFPDPNFPHPPDAAGLDAKSVTKEITFLDHTVKRSDTEREFFGFDTFCAHACEPNCLNILDESDERKYKAVATRDINIGDELSCDYSDLPRDCPMDGTEFDCHCGAPSCKKVIYG